MKKGTVKFYDDSKGYGFIIEENSMAEVFVHSSGLLERIYQTDRVQFELAQGKKGINAVKVKVLK